MTERAVYAEIPAASDAGRVVRALQQAGHLPISLVAQTIRAQHSDAMAAIKRLAASGIVQVRHTDGEPVAVLASQLTDPPEVARVEEKKEATKAGKKAHAADDKGQESERRRDIDTA